MTIGLAGRAEAYSGDGKGQTPTPVTIARRANRQVSQAVPRAGQRAHDTRSRLTGSYLPASTALPPIDRLPGGPHLRVTDSPRPDALRRFVDRTPSADEVARFARKVRYATGHMEAAGFRPPTDVDEGVAQIAAWHRAGRPRIGWMP